MSRILQSVHQSPPKSTITRRFVAAASLSAVAISAFALDTAGYKRSAAEAEAAKAKNTALRTTRNRRCFMSVIVRRRALHQSGRLVLALRDRRIDLVVVAGTRAVDLQRGLEARGRI